MRGLSVALAGVALLLSGCGYNTLQTQDEAVKSAWSEVVNQYQRRADLIPEPRRDRQGFRCPGTEGADRRDRGSRQSGLDPDDARAGQ